MVMGLPFVTGCCVKKTLHSLAQLICLSLRPNKIFKRTLSIYLFHFLLQIAQKVNTTTGMAFIAQVQMQI